MKLTRKQVILEDLSNALKTATHEGHCRLGLLTSVDGTQLCSLVLDPTLGTAEYWETPLRNSYYRSLTAVLPETNWFERANWDLFGIIPNQHPRLKHLLLHEQYKRGFYPLRPQPLVHERAEDTDRQFHFLEVQGEGVYELPVGPIHAGVIEPGHFRFSCLGENILNLEIRLGYVHRGVEKRLTEIPWTKARFVAEAAASDTAAANALAHAIAIESLFELEVPARAQVLRTIALELERIAMHIIDIGGIGTDIGFLGFSTSMSRLRGKALGLAQLLSGSRFLRGFILPGGTKPVSAERLAAMLHTCQQLREDLKPVIAILEENLVATERMDSFGKVSRSLAREFGLVGVAARACGIEYDTRAHFCQGIYPKDAPPLSVEQNGDILSRTRVRIAELWRSLDLVEKLLSETCAGATSTTSSCIELPQQLPPDAVAAGIVEAFRGELIHLIVTGEKGQIRRYCIKDPSSNNWTALSIAIRNNLIADFPLCNKSFSLSYSGNDL